MYKVFLVEDEDEVRQGIRENIKWEDADCLFAGEAPDGEMALPLIQELKPEILLTDIKMPFMDGLSLSRAVKRMMPWVKIILISGYDDFNLVQQALSIGASEYILKPMDSEKIYSVLNSMVVELRREDEQRKSIELLKEKSLQSMPVLRERFLNDLILGSVNPSDILMYAQQYSLSLASRYFIVEKITIGGGSSEFTDRHDFETQQYEHMKVETLLSDLISEESGTIVFYSGRNEINCIIKGQSEEDVSENAWNLAQSFSQEVSGRTALKATIGIGRIVSRTSELYRSNQDAERLIANNRLFGNNAILGSEKSCGLVLEHLDSEGLMEFLKYGRESEIDDFLKNYLPSDDKGNKLPPYYLHYLVLDFLLSIDQFFQQLNVDVSLSGHRPDSIEQRLLQSHSFEDVRGILRKDLQTVIPVRDRRKKDKYGEIISAAKNFIKVKLADEGLNLNLVAASVNISPSHLSTVFSQETGMKFIDYVISKRMEMARSLLKTSSLRSAEIAYEVGYSDPQYFCYSFKKNTGFTPIEFRNKG